MKKNVKKITEQTFSRFRKDWQHVLFLKSFEIELFKYNESKVK